MWRFEKLSLDFFLFVCSKTLIHINLNRPIDMLCHFFDPKWTKKCNAYLNQMESIGFPKLNWNIDPKWGNVISHRLGIHSCTKWPMLEKTMRSKICPLEGGGANPTWNLEISNPSFEIEYLPPSQETKKVRWNAEKVNKWYLPKKRTIQIQIRKKRRSIVLC